MRQVAMAVALLLFWVTTAVGQVSITGVMAQSGEEYVVVDGQLAVGSAIYIDRDYTIQSGGVPPELVGASYIKTANDDKFRITDPFLTFWVDQPVAVYVSHDTRLNKPSWLSAFVDTGWQLVTNDAGFNVYKKDYDIGVVVLGANHGVQDSSMYSVAVIPSDTLPAGPPGGTTWISVTWVQKPDPPETVDISFTWNASAGADGYRLFYRRTGQNYNYLSPEWEGPDTICTLFALPNVDMHFVARAYNEYGESGNSNEAHWEGAN